MPTLFTHYKLGNDILNKLDNKISNNINDNKYIYDIFNQGWDNLFFYPFKWSYYKDFAIYSHTHKVDKFFYNMFKYIIDNNLNNNTYLTNVIHGFINHYVADTIIHPFINAQDKLLGIPHSKIEFMIDTKINSNIKGSSFKECIPILKFKKELIDMLDYTFLKTHKKNNIGKKVNFSHNVGYYVHRYIFFDKLGIKTNLYKIIDLILRKDIKLNKTTYYYKKFDERILNNNKNIWKHRKKQYNYSFIELYNYTIDISIKLHKITYEILHNNKNIDEFIKLLNKVNIENI